MTAKKSSTKKESPATKAANLLVALADHPGAPFYITSALCTALFEAKAGGGAR
jgi:hypothetical protein